MFYFEHYMSAAGLRTLRRATLLRTTDEAWVYQDLRDEIVDVFPDAQVMVAEPNALPPHCELLVIAVMAPYEFPFHDVIYERLDELERWRPLAGHADFLMVYRARWREAEVIAGRDFPAWLRQRRREGRLIRACRRSTWLRRRLQPHYPS